MGLAEVLRAGGVHADAGVDDELAAALELLLGVGVDARVEDGEVVAFEPVGGLGDEPLAVLDHPVDVVTGHVAAQVDELDLALGEEAALGEVEGDDGRALAVVGLSRFAFRAGRLARFGFDFIARFGAGAGRRDGHRDRQDEQREERGERAGVSADGGHR